MSKKQNKTEKPKLRAYTVRLREDLVMQVKKKAKTQDVRIKAIVEQAFKNYLQSET